MRTARDPRLIELIVRADVARRQSVRQLQAAQLLLDETAILLESFRHPTSQRTTLVVDLERERRLRRPPTRQPAGATPTD